jgi:hypothetical protein
MLQSTSHAQPSATGLATDPLPSPRETGMLGVCQLKRAWAREAARRSEVFSPSLPTNSISITSCSTRSASASSADPRRQNLHALGSMPIAGRAGDLVIWHDAIPHGSRPNRASLPRIVQYIRMYPAWQQHAAVWK